MDWHWKWASDSLCKAQRRAFWVGKNKIGVKDLVIFFRVKMQESWSKLKWFLHLGADDRALPTYEQRLQFQDRKGIQHDVMMMILKHTKFI